MSSINKKDSRNGIVLRESQPMSDIDNRVPCRKCKRNFNPDRINKHQSVCIGPINEAPNKPVPRIQKKKKVMGVPL